MLVATHDGFRPATVCNGNGHRTAGRTLAPVARRTDDGTTYQDGAVAEERDIDPRQCITVFYYRYAQLYARRAVGANNPDADDIVQAAFLLWWERRVTARPCTTRAAVRWAAGMHVRSVRLRRTVSLRASLRWLRGSDVDPAEYTSNPEQATFLRHVAGGMTPSEAADECGFSRRKGYYVLRAIPVSVCETHTPPAPSAPPAALPDTLPPGTADVPEYLPLPPDAGSGVLHALALWLVWEGTTDAAIVQAARAGMLSESDSNTPRTYTVYALTPSTTTFGA